MLCPQYVINTDTAMIMNSLICFKNRVQSNRRKHPCTRRLLPDDMILRQKVAILKLLSPMLIELAWTIMDLQITGYTDVPMQEFEKRVVFHADLHSRIQRSFWWVDFHGQFRRVSQSWGRSQPISTIWERLSDDCVYYNDIHWSM
jgi:hypothetical protein